MSKLLSVSIDSYTYEQRRKPLSKSHLTKGKRKGINNILEVCNLVFDVQGIRKDPSFKPTILSRIGSLEEIDNNTQGMYRMMRSLEKGVSLQDFFTEGLQYGTIFRGRTKSPSWSLG